jgi:hypothetical protein
MKSQADLTQNREARSAPPLGSAYRVKIWHDGTWNNDELRRLVAGERIDRNGKRYGVCGECRTVIRLDKPIFGSLHLCDEQAERQG